MPGADGLVSERADRPRPDPDPVAGPPATRPSVPPALILAAGALALLVYAFPGQMSDDAFTYLRQARGRFFDDRHAPAISALWRHLELWIAGPTLLLVVQGGAFLIGGFAIVRRALPPVRAAWATTAVVVFPPVLAALAMISTHALAAALLALGTGALLIARRRLVVAGLIALLAATAIQPSAAVATLPLFVLLFRWTPTANSRRRVAEALAAWAVASALAFGLGAFYAKQASPRWHSTLATFDLAGTLSQLEPDEPDDRLRAALAGTGLAIERDVHAAIRARYAASDVTPLIRGPAAPWPHPADGQAPPAAQRDALAHAARALVADHVGAYIRHRLAVFAELAWIGARHPETAVPSRALADAALRYGIPTRSSELQDAWTATLGAIADHTPLFTPWLYLVIALVLLPLARAHRDVLAIVISGLAMQASLLVTATSAAYAQSTWMIASVCLAVVMLVARRARA